MRRTLALLTIVVAAPAAAWEFSPLPVCTLSHDMPEAGVRVTYDPAREQPYTIAITLTARSWADGEIFVIRYDGARPFAISTRRHGIDGATLSVSDTGFGNLLDGLEFNDIATALLGDTSVALPLAGAAGPVQAFRACAEAPTA